MGRTGPTSEADLLRRQLTAVDAWHRAREDDPQVGAAGTPNREGRMDAARRLDVLQEQHRAIVARTELALARSVRTGPAGAPVRAVLVHRRAWFVDRLGRELARHDVEVVASLENGAEATGIVVAEQPDLLLVEDALAMVPAEQVVREARRFSPETVVLAQVAHEGAGGPLLAAGAHGAVGRAAPPAEVARALLGLLDARLVDA